MDAKTMETQTETGPNLLDEAYEQHARDRERRERGGDLAIKVLVKTVCEECPICQERHTWDTGPCIFLGDDPVCRRCAADHVQNLWRVLCSGDREVRMNAWGADLPETIAPKPRTRIHAEDSEHRRVPGADTRSEPGKGETVYVYSLWDDLGAAPDIEGGLVWRGRPAEDYAQSTGPIVVKIRLGMAGYEVAYRLRKLAKIVEETRKQPL